MPTLQTAPETDPDDNVRVISAASAKAYGSPAGFVRYLGWLARHTALVRVLARAQLKATVRRSKLYYLWWLLDPLLDTLCYAFLFIVIRRGGGGGAGEEHAIPLIAFLLAGIMPWRWTASCWSISGHLWDANKALIQQVRFPYFVLLLSRFLSEAWLYVVSLAVLFGTLLISQVPPHWTWALLPAWLVVHGLMVIAFMPFFAVAAAFSQDVSRLLPYFLRLMFFCSPILYEVTALPGAVRDLFWLNPLTLVMTGYRDLLLYGRLPGGGATLIFLAAMAVVWLVGTMLFVRFEPYVSRSIARSSY